MLMRFLPASDCKNEIMECPFCFKYDLGGNKARSILHEFTLLFVDELKPC